MRAVVKVMFIVNSDTPTNDIKDAIQDGATANDYSGGFYTFTHKSDIYCKIEKQT
jgi:hypothetical protein